MVNYGKWMAAKSAFYNYALAIIGEHVGHSYAAADAPQAFCVSNSVHGRKGFSADQLPCRLLFADCHLTVTETVTEFPKNSFRDKKCPTIRRVRTRKHLNAVNPCFTKTYGIFNEKCLFSYSDHRSQFRLRNQKNETMLS